MGTDIIYKKRAEGMDSKKKNDYSQNYIETKRSSHIQNL